MWFDLTPIISFAYLFLHPVVDAGIFFGSAHCPADMKFAEKVWSKAKVESDPYANYNATPRAVYQNLARIHNTTYGPLEPPQCGFSTVSHSRIVGGTRAAAGSWPWMALLGYCPPRTDIKPKWKCDGALISHRHVLTAAHCISGIGNLYTVRLGELDLSTESDGKNYIDVLVEKATIHPQYRATSTANDVAVLRLMKDVKFTNYIRPICLPLSDEMRVADFENDFPYLAGWGESENSPDQTKHLMEVQVPVTKIDRCRDSYKSMQGIVIDTRVICTAYDKGGKDACRGDSGGPLMLAKGEYFYAIGIVSNGNNCGDPNFPGVHTKVGRYMDFITKNLQ